MKLVKSDMYYEYYLCTYKEELDTLHTLESLGFNIGCRLPCDCDGPIRFEGKAIVNTDSLEEIFSIAETLSTLIGLKFYPRIYSNPTNGRGFFIHVSFPTHISKESEVLTNEQEHGIRMYNRDMFASL